MTKTSKDGDDRTDRYDDMSTKDLRALLVLRGIDPSQFLEKSELKTEARRLDTTDYEEEAHKLFRSLNLPTTNVSSTDRRPRYSNIDAIWKHPSDDGGTVYVGNAQAASDRRTLEERNIVAIVNCQDESSRNYFEDDDTFEYYRFLVTRLSYQATKGRNITWSRNNNDGTTEEQQLFLAWWGYQKVFEFIQGHIAKGNSVLIHCLAGAHRAGATGTAWLMYQTGKGLQDSLQMAKACRPIISPFGALLECLHVLEEELKVVRAKEQN